MTASAPVKPLGFTIVPPHLVAINLFTHIERMANGKRSQTIHATSRKRHKFKKLQEDIIEWRKNPPMHLQDLKAAHTEWHPAGIREITDKPGQYMFSRAILSPKQPPQLVVPEKMLDPPHLLIPTQARTRTKADLTDGTNITAKSAVRPSPPAHPPELAFYSLEQNKTGRDWASITKTLSNRSTPSSHENRSTISSNDNRKLPPGTNDDLSQSPKSQNLLESQSTEDNEQKVVPTRDKTQDQEQNVSSSPDHQTIATLRSDISALRATIDILTTQLQQVTKLASSMQDTIEKVDFITMNDQINTLKEQTGHLQHYRIDHATLAARIANVESQRATKVELQNQQIDLEKSMSAKISAQIDNRWQSTDTKFTQLQSRIANELQHLDDIATQRETVVDELNTAFETLRDELSQEVRENTMDELHDDLKQDSQLQGKLKQIIQAAQDPVILQEAVATILDDQLAEFRTHAKDRMETMLGSILQPSVHAKNPYNPLDRALDAIQTQVKDMTEAGISRMDDKLENDIQDQIQAFVTKGIQEIDTVIKGTTDQAIEMVMKSTRNNKTYQSVPFSEPLPTVTPQRTF